MTALFWGKNNHQLIRFRHVKSFKQISWSNFSDQIWSKRSSIQFCDNLGTTESAFFLRVVRFPSSIRFWRWQYFYIFFLSIFKRRHSQWRISYIVKSWCQKFCHQNAQGLEYEKDFFLKCTWKFFVFLCNAKHALQPVCIFQVLLRCLASGEPCNITFG